MGRAAAHLRRHRSADPHYTMAEPTDCDDNSDAISCTHTDANWD
jgi:hypothetical protein